MAATAYCCCKETQSNAVNEKMGACLDSDGKKEVLVALTRWDLTWGRHRIERCASGTNAKQSEKTTVQEFDGLFPRLPSPPPRKSKRPERSVGWGFHFVSIHGGESTAPAPLTLQLRESRQEQPMNESILFYQTKGKGEGRGKMPRSREVEEGKPQSQYPSGTGNGSGSSGQWEEELEAGRGEWTTR